MADETEEGVGGGDAGDGGDGGSVLKKYGPLAAIVLLAQVVLAWVVISVVFKDNVPEEEQEDLIPDQSVELLSGSGEEQTKTRLPYYYQSKEMGSITANPAGTNAERFVVVSVQLGLEAYNRDEDPPDDDITGGLAENAEILDKIKLYDQRIISVIGKTIRLKTIDELDGAFIHEIEDEIRKRLNNEIFSRLFAVTEEQKTEVIVSEVDISQIIMQ